MQLKDIFIKEQPERFDQWITQLASEHGITLSVESERYATRYSEIVNGKTISEIDTMPVGERLRLRAARRELEISERRVRGGFLEILGAALTRDYHAEPIESEKDNFEFWMRDSMSDIQFDDPNEESKRQAFVEETRRGLPPIAQATPSEPTANQAPTTPSPALTGPPKKKWSREQITFALIVGGFLIALCTCVAAWLVVPQVQEIVQLFMRGAIPSLTPTLFPPTPTP
jgi:hypothetical protein